MKEHLSSLDRNLLLIFLIALGWLWPSIGIGSEVSVTKTSQRQDDRAPEHFLINDEQPLGLISESGANAKAVGITEYGLTTQVKQKWTFDHVETAGILNVFPDTTREIFWFAQFGIAGSFKNNFVRSFRIAWHAPDGSVHREQKFKSSLINETFVKTSLKLPQPLPDHLIGRWRVRVWKKDTLIDDRVFEIVRT